MGTKSHFLLSQSHLYIVDGFNDAFLSNSWFCCLTSAHVFSKKKRLGEARRFPVVNRVKARAQ